MNSKIKLGKIKSKYLIEEIFKYIDKENFKYKLFSYSKQFQTQLCIGLYDYQERYIKKEIGDFNVSSYIYDLPYNKPYNKYYLEDKLNYILNKSTKVKKDLLSNFVLNYYQKYWINLEETKKQDNTLIDYFSKEIQIDMNSPFFDYLSKNEIFEKIFSITIPTYIMDQHDSENYIKAFKEFEESNINYSSLRFLYKDIEKLKNCLSKYNINFKKNKRLFIIEKNDSANNKSSIKYNNFYEKLFSFKNILVNLEYLKLSKSDLFETYKIEIPSFININNFNLLEQLDLFGFRFENKIKLELKNLKVIKLENCENITFGEKTCSTIKYLSLINSLLPQQVNLLKFQNLETFILYSKNNEKDRQEYNLIIDFSSLVNLLYLECEIFDFIHLENNEKLKELIIHSDEYNTQENEKKLIEKIVSLITLKSIKFYIKQIGDKEISEIQGVNYTVTSITINWMNTVNDCILFGLQKIFPNLTDLVINISNSNYLNKNSSGAYLQSVEYYYSRIKNIKIIGGGNTNIKLYCNYEALESFEIIVKNKIKNLEEGLAFLMKHCPYEFKQLRNLQLTFNNFCLLEEELLVNLYNNISKMPRLKSFVLNCTTLKIDGNFKNDFFKKIKKLNLDLYNFSINKF